MQNLGGCGALGAFGGLLVAALVYWSVVAPGLDSAAAASTARCLFLIVGGMFLLTAAIIVGAPMGGKGRR